MLQVQTRKKEVDLKRQVRIFSLYKKKKVHMYARVFVYGCIGEFEILDLMILCLDRLSTTS